MKVALDTNILAYAQGVNGDVMKQVAVTLLRALPPDAVVLPAQVVSELFQVLVRKGKFTPADARSAAIGWCDFFPVVDTTRLVLLGAAELAVTHRLSFWDGLIVASAAEAGCRLLLSEDLHPGFTWSSVTIANPFTTPRHPLLESLLDPQP